jgi:ribonuclease BN (tRNA processing enzyme)
MVSTWDGPSDFFSTTFDVREYSSRGAFEVGPFRVSAQEVPHFIEAHALRFEHGDAAFGYTSDLGPDARVTDFMDGVDLLLTEATLPLDHGEDPAARGHLTAEEAADIASAAGAHSLLLTHVPTELQAGVIARVRGRYDGPVALARSGQVYAIAQRLARAV